MRAAWESPKRTPVGEERLEADRRAVVAKIAKMEKAAKRVAAAPLPVPPHSMSAPKAGGVRLAACAPGPAAS